MPAPSYPPPRSKARSAAALRLRLGLTGATAGLVVLTVLVGAGALTLLPALGLLALAAVLPDHGARQ